MLLQKTLPKNNDDNNRSFRQTSVNHKSRGVSCEVSTHIASFRDKFQSDFLNSSHAQHKQIINAEDSHSKGVVQDSEKRQDFDVCEPEHEIYNISILPTIHELTRQRQKLRDSSIKASNRCKFAETMKLKKLKQFEANKIKFEKIKKVRENHSKEKQILNQSRMEIQGRVKSEKKRMRDQIFDHERNQLAESTMRNFEGKHRIAVQMKNRKKEDMMVSLDDKRRQLERRKSLHMTIMETHSVQRKKRISIQKIKKRIATENYRTKILKQYKINKSIYNEQVKMIPKLHNKTHNFSIEAQKYEEEAQRFKKMITKH